MRSKSIFATVVILVLAAFVMGWKAFSGAPSLAEPLSAANSAGPTQQPSSSLPGDDLPAPQSLLGIKGVAAFLIDDILPGSPAEKADLKPGDLVTWVNGKQVDSITGVLKISRNSPGHKVELFILRYNPVTQERDLLTLELTTAPLKAIK